MKRIFEFGGDVFELLIGNFYQYADFIIAVAGGALERGRLGAARVAAAELTDDPHQWFGQHHIEQRQEGLARSLGEPDDAALAVLSVQQGVGCAFHRFEHTVVLVPLGNDLGRGTAVSAPVCHETLEEAEQGGWRQQAPAVGRRPAACGAGTLFFKLVGSSGRIS